ncbi:hypothetical protein ACRRTK_010436 [Alexandromys fortis]
MLYHKAMIGFSSVFSSSCEPRACHVQEDSRKTESRVCFTSICGYRVRDEPAWRMLILDPCFMMFSL